MAVFAYETIAKLTSIIEDNLRYSKELRKDSISPYEDPLLNSIENSATSLIESGKELQKKLKDLNPDLNYTKYPDNLINEVDAFYEKVKNLKNEISAFKKNNAGKELTEDVKLLVSDEVLSNLEKAEMCHVERFEVPRLNLVIKNDPETRKRRDDRIKNIQVIKQNPHSAYKYDDLNQEEKDKYNTIINYWFENIKDKGFEANADFLGYFGAKADATGVELSDGETAARNDIYHNIMVPRKADGSMDQEGTMEMMDGANLYSYEQAIKLGEKIEKVTTEQLGIGPVVGKNLSEEEKEASKEYKKKRNENKSKLAKEILSSEEGYKFEKTRNFSANLGALVGNNMCALKPGSYFAEYMMWSSRCISQGLKENDKKHIQINEKESDVFTLDDSAQPIMTEKTNSDIYDIPKGPFAEPVKPIFDSNLSLEEKCYELNRITEMLLNTKNAYFGHTNSEEYTNMLESMMKVRKHSEDKLRDGEFFTKDEAEKLREEISEASANIRSYMDVSLKNSYSTTNGEERAKLSLIAYDIVRPLDAADYLNQYNANREREGHQPFNMKDLKWENNVEAGQLIKSLIDKGVSKANKSLSDEMKIDDNLKKMIQEPDALDDFKAMFDVKHHARIVRWNSSLYNKSKEALDDFVQYRNRVRSDMLTDKKPSEEDLKGLKENYVKCQDLLKRYLVKSYGTDGEISDAIKKTAAGTARGVGAAGALSLFTGQKENKMKKVQQTSLKNLFKEEMGKTLMNNSRDKKRKAASRAMDNYKKEAKKKNNPTM